MVSKNVLFIIGDFVEDYEVMVPFQSLLAFGVNVDAVCPGKKKGDSCKTAIHDFLGDQTYSEKRGHNFALNADFDEVDVDKYDALVVPGGRAPEYLSINDAVIKIVQKFHDQSKIIASICHGQLILASAGVLEGKHCTAYPAVKPVIISAGGLWKDPEPISSCFVDGNLITGAAWPGHPEFISLIIGSLGGHVHGGDRRVLLLCGDFMEDYEVMVPFQAMLALGYHVDAVCPGKKRSDRCPTAVHDFEGDQTYTEKRGHDFSLTATFDEIDVDSYDALVVPGGRAPEYLSLNQKVLDIVRIFDKSKKPIASICHGQQILAAAGVLKGKKCTAYPAVKPIVVLAGGIWLEPEPITKCFYDDSGLITGAAWPAHPDFISLLMSALGTSIKF